MPQQGADDAHDVRGGLWNCRNMGLLMLIDAHGAGGWLPDCRNKGLMMLMMLGAGFEIAGTWGGIAGTWGC